MTDSVSRKEYEKIQKELAEQKQEYAKLMEKKFVNIFDQSGAMFQVLQESWGTVLKCKLCGSRGGTRSLSHGNCQYSGTQVWYRNDNGKMVIYDVAMFDSYREY